MTASTDKNSVRREARLRRRVLSPSHRDLAARQVADELLRRSHAAGWRRVAAYVAVASELDPLPFMQAAADLEFALPCVAADGSMCFRAWRPGQPLVDGLFAIPQPDVDAPVWAVADLDAVLLPLLGFDRFGTRLGSGAGYYDRALAGSRVAVSPALIGIGFAVQQFECLPADPWDIHLDAVVSEDGWLDCHRS